ncbi:MAG: type restriction enzyme res subunit [Planctomycetaceae bacterium]|nr:type restriction enzyme res subunit [Planctomycetaceae bacterium]
MTEPLSEWATRKKIINGMLQKCGWEIVPFDLATPLSNYARHAVEEFPTENGPADYAMFVDGRCLGVVEAKRQTVGPQSAVVQAERYSRGMPATGPTWRGFRVPFLYSTSGELIWFRDIRHELNQTRNVAEFHTPGALAELINRDFEAACGKALALPNDQERLRKYQKEANAATEKAISEHKRQMLIAMATGTGKTFTMVNQSYRLLKSGIANRILFLVDRRALAAQSVRAFAAFEPEPNQKFDKIYEVYSNRFQKGDFGEDEAFDSNVLPKGYLTDPKAKHAFVYICTIQRMAVQILGRQAVFSEDGDDIDEDAEQVDIPIHAFDVIIADECHRGYTSSEQSVWRDVLNHFDAIRIGLTATPAKHTTAYFSEVVFRYSTEQAVRDGHLLDFDLVKIRSDVRINGMFLQTGDAVEHIDTKTGAVELDALEDEREFVLTEIERKVTSPDSNRQILLELKKYADAHEERYGRFPKTLIFAANDLPHTSHADQLQELAVEIFGRGESFVRKITGRADRPLQLIREFRNRPHPGIAITVDLLSTGVDIPDLEFVVFLRSVKSRILFVQMLGRGTRKSPDLPDKSHFTVFDCFDGTLFQYFKDATEETSEVSLDKPSRSIEDVIEDIWSNKDREYNVRCLVKRLQRIDKEMSPEAREQFAAQGIPDGDVANFATQLPQLLTGHFMPTMQLLRKPEFQAVVKDHPRRTRTFLRALDHEDSVSSEYLIRDGKGNHHKPEDYLDIFARFVRENTAQIEAVKILMERPADWSTEALKELKQKLTAAPERFTVEVLQKAHEMRYRKSLVDIISMVKHAAADQNPLWTAQERVDAAIIRVSTGRIFTLEQQQWLDRIRQHLIVNLSIDKDDFDYIPTFEGAGGWGKANKVFEGKLEDLLRDINKAVAA